MISDWVPKFGLEENDDRKEANVDVEKNNNIIDNVSTEVNDPDVERLMLDNIGVTLQLQKKVDEDLTLVEITLNEKVLKFLKHPYDVKSWEKRKDYRLYLVKELNKKRYNGVYDGKSIVEKYKEAVENKKVFSNKPFWKLEDEDELDELLKLREEINMHGDGNCTTYAVISQLYPQTLVSTG
jgi:hypothetical protein